MNAKKSPMRRRLTKILAIGVPLFIVMMFFKWRADDLSAWPEYDPTIPSVSEKDDSAFATEADITEFLGMVATLPPIPTNAYTKLQVQGFDSLDATEEAAICGRMGVSNSVLAAYRSILSNGGFAKNSTNELQLAQFASASGEYEILSEYILKSSSCAPDERAKCIGAGLRFFLNSGSLMGRACALQNTMLHTRESILETLNLEKPVLDIEARIVSLRSLQSIVTDSSLASAIQQDMESVLGSSRMILDQVRGLSTQNEPRMISGVTAAVINWLSPDDETTYMHIRGLFQRLITNAQLSYSPTSMITGLPKWCIEDSRPPWSRDPVGAMLSKAYMRHAVFAAAIEPSILLEIRAAMLASALRRWFDVYGSYPETLAQLVTEPDSVLEWADLVDPFSPDGAKLIYSRDADGWRFYSIGLNQIDGGGCVDAYNGDARASGIADLIFTSRELEIRQGKGATK